ncbi:Uncharacterised protein [Clostridioides difficile]|nr:Uncharacterised protein [Clostridioides difficile]
MNLANKLTLIRIFLVPIFLIFIVVKGIPYGSFIATIIFILAALTGKSYSSKLVGKDKNSNTNNSYSVTTITN